MSNLFPYKNMKGIQYYNTTGSQLQRIKLIIFTIVQIGRVFIIKKLPEVIEPLIRRLPSIYEASQQNNLILGMEWKVQEWNCAMVSVKAKLTFQPLSDSLPQTNIVCIRVSTPCQKHYPLLLAKSPLKFANCPSPPFLTIPSFMLVFCELPLKIGFFSEPQEY